MEHKGSVKRILKQRANSCKISLFQLEGWAIHWRFDFQDWPFVLCSHWNVVLWDCVVFLASVWSEIRETSKGSPTRFLHWEGEMHIVKGDSYVPIGYFFWTGGRKCQVKNHTEPKTKLSTIVMHISSVCLSSFPLIISCTIHLDRTSMLLHSALLYFVHVSTLPSLQPWSADSAF